MQNTAPLITLLAALPALVQCSTTHAPAAQHVPEKAAIIQRILSLPAFSLHEESVEDFRKRLETASTYTPLPEEGAAILAIGGDGVRGERLFRMEKDGTLHILEHDWEETKRDAAGHAEAFCFSLSRVAPGSPEIQSLGSCTTPPALFSPAGEPLLQSLTNK